LKKLGYLESLRGIAALVVVFAHYAVGFYPALFWPEADHAHTAGNVEFLIAGTPLNVLYNGDFSVSIFFVLSGFVLSYKFFKDRTSDVLLAPLVAKRYVRLLIPVLFSNVLAYAMLSSSLFFSGSASAITRSSEWLVGFWRFGPNIWTMLRESFYGNFFHNENLYNNVLWTMTYEFYGSLIVFGFLAFFRNSPRRVIAYVLLMLVFRRSYYLAFVLGIMLSDWHSSEANVLKRVRGKGPFLVALLAGLLLGSVPMERQGAGTLYGAMQNVTLPRVYHVLGAFLVMVAVLHVRQLQAFLSKKPFLFLGRISFSLYILHFLMLTSLSCWLLLAFAPHVSYHAAFLAAFGISLPLIMTASQLTYKYVDQSGIRLSQALYSALLRRKKMNSESAAPPAPPSTAVTREGEGVRSSLLAPDGN